MGAVILCDTDVLIDYFEPAQPRYRQTAGLLNQIPVEDIGLSSITAIELLAGARNKIEQQALQASINVFATVHIDATISRMALQLVLRYKLSHNLRLADAFIAATALANDFTLFTYNTRDFQFINGLRLHKFQS